MGRPRLKLNVQEIINYARLGASNREIADMVGCDESTIRDRFPAELTKARSQRKTKLRQLQWKAAEAGNTSMLIWLGKNELGQSDTQNIHLAGTGEEGAIKLQVQHAMNRSLAATYRRSLGRICQGSARPR
jgi:hypothetical protein